MNLHDIVGSCVAAVNPWITAQYQKSTGYAVDPSTYQQVPAYAAAVPIEVQWQALQYQDLLKLDGANIQGTRRALYVSGNWQGMVRSEKKGGDLISMPDGSVWLVAMELENWSDTAGWCKVAVTLQNGA